MNKAATINDTENLRKNNLMAVLYFTGKDCGACDAIKIKMEEILSRFPKIKSCEIDGEKSLDTAAFYNVFSLPVFLLYIEGKETLRTGRYVDLLEVKKSIERYYSMVF